MPERNLVRRLRKQTNTSDNPKRAQTNHLLLRSDSELFAQLNLTRNQITVRVHDEYSIELDSQLGAYLCQLNDHRRRQGLKKYFASTRFRPIQPPRITPDGIKLDVAPINYAHWIMLADASAPASAREYVEKQIDQVFKRVPKELQSTHPVLNWRNCHPIGVLIVISTKDGKTLLRRRGESVLTEAGKWDVSFGGYCGDVDIAEGFLDVGSTAEHELRREIGAASADPRELMFTGLHLNRATRALDVLGLWKVDATSHQLAKLLTRTYPGARIGFMTRKRAEEPFVWDATNIIADLNTRQLFQSLTQAGYSVDDMAVESLAALTLALAALGL